MLPDGYYESGYIIRRGQILHRKLQELPGKFPR